jgi:hypothetical protein
MLVFLSVSTHENKNAIFNESKEQLLKRAVQNELQIIIIIIIIIFYLKLRHVFCLY